MKVSNQIIRKLIEPIVNKDIKNWRIVLDAIKHWLSDSQMEMLLEIIHNDGYKVHKQGDIVKFKPESWHFKDDMMEDIMKDWLLMDKRGYIYGKIIDDGSYNDKFNPFYYDMKLKVFLHLNNEKKWQDRELKVVDHKVNTTNLFPTKPPMEWIHLMNNLV